MRLGLGGYDQSTWHLVVRAIGQTSLKQGTGERVNKKKTTSKQNFIYKFLGILYAIRRVIKGVQYECGDKNKFKFKIG